MSLETTYMKLRTIPHRMPLWKLAIFCGFIPASISVVVITFLLNFEKVSPLQIPLIEFGLLAILTILYLTSAMVAILSVIFLAFILIKIRNRFYQSNGVIIGNSLATNEQFLDKFSKGLSSYLTNLLKSYNDPRFEEQDSRLLSLENKQQPPNALDYNRIILDQRKIIFKLEMRLKEKDLDKESTKKLQVELQGALETIAKSNERIAELEKKIKELGDK
ncbi:MAG: hypothetical protein ACYDAJ_09035 [Nitrosotalea sp.]